MLKITMVLSLTFLLAACSTPKRRLAGELVEDVLAAGKAVKTASKRCTAKNAKAKQCARSQSTKLAAK